jgi:hypothetical protein
MRMTAASVRPPTYPEMAPITEPRAKGNATQTSAICRSIHPAARIRVSRSRPRLSVPSQWLALGGCKAARSSTETGS